MELYKLSEFVISEDESHCILFLNYDISSGYNIKLLKITL